MRVGRSTAIPAYEETLKQMQTHATLVEIPGSLSAGANSALMKEDNIFLSTENRTRY